MSKRREHREHRFFGEIEGGALADWLNRWHGKKTGQSVTQLVNDFKLLSQEKRDDDTRLMDRKYVEAMQSASRKAIVHLSELQPGREYAKIARRADRLLSRCSMRPRLIEHGRRMKFGWCYASSPALSEGLHLVVTVAQMGLLDSIRTCANEKCGAWFFKKFPQQKFCPKRNCEVEFRQSEPGKAHRREIYRRSYESRKVLGRV